MFHFFSKHNVIVGIAVVLLFTNCTSIEKYNQTISQPISVEKLQSDINYTQHKLEKLYQTICYIQIMKLMGLKRCFSEMMNRIKM